MEQTTIIDRRRRTPVDLDALRAQARGCAGFGPSDTQPGLVHIGNGVYPAARLPDGGGIRLVGIPPSLSKRPRPVYTMDGREWWGAQPDGGGVWLFQYAGPSPEPAPWRGKVPKPRPRMPILFEPCGEV